MRGHLGSTRVHREAEGGAGAQTVASAGGTDSTSRVGPARWDNQGAGHMAGSSCLVPGRGVLVQQGGAQKVKTQRGGGWGWPWFPYFT